jgi:hypothetical protein
MLGYEHYSTILNIYIHTFTPISLKGTSWQFSRATALSDIAISEEMPPASLVQCLEGFFRLYYIYFRKYQ